MKLVIVSTALALSACGPGTLAGSCAYEVTHSCEEMRGGDDVKARFKDGCELIKGTFTEGACPTQGVIAVCEISSSDTNYFYAGATAMDEGCKLVGGSLTRR